MSQEAYMQGEAVTGWQRHWSLDPEITFLNHGSFGACPLAVLSAQRQLREQLERDPVRFFEREFEPLLDGARRELANFIGAIAEDLAFVPNATTGVNAVLRSLDFEAGDELLTTDHEYNACRNVLDFVALRSDARIVIAPVPLPIDSPAQIVESVMARVSRQTKLVLLDHVSSQTGLVFPIEQVVGELAKLGIDTLIDGAHAPGMVPLNLQKLGAAYYTGNCHKWLCAPKGAAFLYVRGDRQLEIRPMTISHGANSPRTDKSRFLLEFDWMGTSDPTPYLCVPVAIQFMGSLLEGGWGELMSKNRELAIAARRVLAIALKVGVPCPDEMIGSLASLPLPDGSAEELHCALLDKFNIQVPVFPWPAAPKRVIRISAQIYNRPEQYHYLAKALDELLGN